MSSVMCGTGVEQELDSGRFSFNTASHISACVEDPDFKLGR